MEMETIEAKGRALEQRATPRAREANGPVVNAADSSFAGAQAPLHTESSTKSRAMRGYLMVGVAAAVILGGVGAYLVKTAHEEDTDDAVVSADVVPVGTRIAGQIVRVGIHDNDLVKRGEVLAQIDDADYIAREKQAEAEVASAQAQAAAADAQVQVVEATSKGGLQSARALLTGSSVGVTGAAAQSEAVRAALARAEVDAKKSELNLTRSKELRASSAIPPQALDDAQADYDSTMAALAQARAQLTLAQQARSSAIAQVSEAQGRLNQNAPVEAQISTARAQADLAHARVNSAQAALDLARLQLSYTKILSPGDGVASKLSVHPGQIVGVGQPVIELVPVDTYVVANFKETQVGKIHPGQKAEVRVDAFPGRKLEGKVESLSGGTGASFALLPPDNATGNFVKVVQRVPIRVAWVGLPPEITMRVGLSADVTVNVGN